MSGYYSDQTPAPERSKLAVTRNEITDASPDAPCGSKDGMGDSPFSKGSWNTEPCPKVDRHDGMMNLHLGECTKPLS